MIDFNGSFKDIVFYNFDAGDTLKLPSLPSDYGLELSDRLTDDLETVSFRILAFGESPALMVRLVDVSSVDFNGTVYLVAEQ